MGYFEFLVNFYIIIIIIIITVQKNFLEHFDQYFKKSKHGLPIVFSNTTRPMGGGNFRDEEFTFRRSACLRS